MNRWIFVAGVVVIVGGIGLGVASMRKFSGAGQPSSSAPVGQLLEEAAKYEANGEKLKVKDIYAKIIADYPDYDKVEEVQDKLGQLNLAIITSNTPAPGVIMREVVPGDSLGKLARQYNTTKMPATMIQRFINEPPIIQYKITAHTIPKTNPARTWIGVWPTNSFSRASSICPFQ